MGFFLFCISQNSLILQRKNYYKYITTNRTRKSNSKAIYIPLNLHYLKPTLEEAKLAKGKTKMQGGFNCGGSSAIAEALKVNVYGNGTDTLVLSHGFGLDQSTWRYMIPYLACFFKVVVFDLVFSPNVKPKLYDERKYSSFDGYAKDLVCVLDNLNVKRSIYVGHSMSAMIGSVAAIHRPQLFQHLILLNASPRSLLKLSLSFIWVCVWIQNYSLSLSLLCFIG